MPVLSDTAKKINELKLAAAVTDYRKDSSNADVIIWLGRRNAYLGYYDKAIEIFSKGITLHPADARMYRHRGHRYITLRCYDNAIADLETAAKLIKDKPDEMEPDGLPNAKNIPTSTLQFNIWYHLGLAYFVKGDYTNALNAYRNCMKVSANNDMYAAVFSWTYLTLLKLDRDTEAKALYYSADGKAEVIENGEYRNLYIAIYTDQPVHPDIDEVASVILKGANPVGISTISFAVGFYCLVKGDGDKERATKYFTKATGTGMWSSFGYIAAEAELKRMK